MQPTPELLIDSESNTSLNRMSIQKEMYQLVGSYTISQSIFAAAELDIAERLKDGASHYNDLATATGTHSEPLYRLLLVLAEIGVLSETEPGYFKLGSLGSCLLEDGDHSLKNFILLHSKHFSGCWANLIYSLRTGESAFVHTYGMEPYQYIKQKPALAKIFDRAMIELSEMHQTSVLAAYDFSAVEKIVDIGGGQGVMVMALLNRYPRLKAVLFEQPHVIDKARMSLEKEGVIDRCELVGGDFLQSVPAGGDVYLLKNVLNDWDDERAIKILQNCHQAMAGKGRLLAIQRIASPNASLQTKALDLNKLLMRSALGGVRTEEQMRELYHAAGLTLSRIIPTEIDMSIIEGVPIGKD